MSLNRKKTDAAVWNLKNLDEPSLISINYSKEEYDVLEKKLQTNLLTGSLIEHWLRLTSSSTNLLQNEKYIIDKIIYKNYNTLSKEKSVQILRKLKRLLNSLIDLKLSDVLQTIKTLSKSIENRLICLPSREIFEYCLCRVFASHQIISYSIKTIKNDAYSNISRSIKNALFLPNNILFLSTISRLYSIKNKYKSDLAEIYDFLRNNLANFKPIGKAWTQQFRLETFPLNLNANTCALIIREEREHEMLFSNELSNALSSLANKNNFDQDIGDLVVREEDEKKEIVNYTTEPNIKQHHNEHNEKVLLRKLGLFLNASFDENRAKLNRKMFKKKLRLYLKKKCTRNESFQLFLNVLIDTRVEFEQKLREHVLSERNCNNKLICKLFFKSIRLFKNK